MEKVTVREIIERLAKCDWDSEISCISKEENKLSIKEGDPKRFNRQIVSIARSSRGTQIVFQERS